MTEQPVMVIRDVRYVEAIIKDARDQCTGCDLLGSTGDCDKSTMLAIEVFGENCMIRPVIYKQVTE